MLILLVEDDKDLSQFMQEGLIREGFSVDLARNGKEAITLSEERGYDVILLDVVLPELDGFAVLNKLRAHGNHSAILMVTCQGGEKHRLKGLDSGADDYMVKPFQLTELVARIRAISRRIPIKQKSLEPTILHAGEVQMDLLKREVKRNQKIIPLTKKEFDLLECFMRRPGQVLSQAVISQHLALPDFHSSSNAVEVHVKNLRAKLDADCPQSLIRTVRGCGYAFEPLSCPVQNATSLSGDLLTVSPNTAPFGTSSHSS